MKRHGWLWDELISFENLLLAAQKARRRKAGRPGVAAFHFNLERELWKLHEELASKTYTPRPHRTFTICDKKPRLISAAPYRDRVVHHALCNVIEPIFERSFIHDSYACRPGKGTHAAVRRCQHYLRRHAWAWKADICSYFPSIDHALLKGLLVHKIADPHVLWLAFRIIDRGPHPEPSQLWFAGDDLFTVAHRPHGLPIGNQTSQFFANVYLDPLDHHLQDRLGVCGYVRYVDDLVVFANDRARLLEVRTEAGRFLEGLRLRLHPHKDAIFPAAQGVPFLGYRVQRSHLGLDRDNVWRFRRPAPFAEAVQLPSDRPELGAATNRELDWPRLAGRYA